MLLYSQCAWLASLPSPRLSLLRVAPQAFECWSSLGLIPRFYPSFSLVPSRGTFLYRVHIFKQWGGGEEGGGEWGAEYIDEAVSGMKAHSCVLWNSLTSIEQYRIMHTFMVLMLKSSNIYHLQVPILMLLLILLG